MFRLFVTMTAAVQLLAAQAFRVEGIVRDGSTGLPVPNARVFYVPGRVFTQERAKSTSVFAVTGADGRFHFEPTKPEPFFLSAEAEGFVPSSGPAKAGAITDSARFATIDLSLLKAAAISGRLLDRDGDVPITGAQIRAFVTEYRDGARVVRPVGGSMSNDRGDFEVLSLPAGSYVLEIAANPQETFVQKSIPDSEPTGYRRTWWPGGERFDSATPVEVLPGTNLSAGNVRVSRRRLFSLASKLPAELCGATGSRSLSLTETLSDGVIVRSRADLRCGEEFTVTNLSPGRYELVGEGSPVPIHAEVTVSEDATIDLHPTPPVTVLGKIETPSGFRERATGRLRIQLVPVQRSARTYSADVDAENRFTVQLPPYQLFDVALAGLPAGQGFYVSAIEYGGAPMSDGVEINPSNGTQSLSIAVAADGGSIRGFVRSKGAGQPDIRVVAAPWPFRTRGEVPVYQITSSGPDGQFSFLDLAPGTYRLFGAPPELWEGELQKPGGLISRAAQGLSVTLTPRGNIAPTIDLN